MNTLKTQLIRQILADGPINLAEYMQSCLLHPTQGYYTSHSPFGTQGDFTTAPEISQMFGELLGLCLAQSWMDQGAPRNCCLAELGPGRGSLMRDILRATAKIEGFTPQVVLVEASAALRDVQRQNLAGYEVTWVDHVCALPEQPLWLVANEFFDALPIRQFTRTQSGWDETSVGSDGNALHFGRTPKGALPLLAHRVGDVQLGDVVELCPPLPAIMTEITSRLSKGGAALIVDYGGWRSLGDTFQAMEKHRFVDPLERPGQADLTAHVDFEHLSRAAAPCRVSAMTPQGVLLERLGITARAQVLAKSLQGDQLDSHIAAHRRLTHPEEMGSLFKGLAIVPAAAPLPPGFEM